ncbi:MAG: helix-turn-helix transcriptional regulator [Bacteroidales bacterium]|nr:helix-turn-helix transcriptional regulator [Bacteroidales bacterium]
MHIGKRIKEVCEVRNISANQLASMISCDRSNIYYIFQRENIDTGLLIRIAKALHYDFFRDYSEEIFPINMMWNATATYNRHK